MPPHFSSSSTSSQRHGQHTIYSRQRSPWWSQHYTRQLHWSWRGQFWIRQHASLPTIQECNVQAAIADVFLFRVQDSFFVAQTFRLPCDITKQLCTIAIQRDFLSPTTLFITKLCSVFAVFSAALLPPNIPESSRPNCLTTTSSRMVLCVTVDCLQPVTSCTREWLPSTPTPHGMIGNKSHSAIEKSAMFECVFSCWPHQSVISGIQNILLFSTGWECYALTFRIICTHYFRNSGSECRRLLVAINKSATRSLIIPPFRTDPVWGRARSGLVHPQGRTGPGPRLAVMDWMGLLWTGPNRGVFLNFEVDQKTKEVKL